MNDSLQTRFEELLNVVLDGSASSAERTEFRDMLDAHPRLVAVYMRQVRMHVMLQSCVGGALSQSEPSRSFRFTWRRAAAVAVVICAMLTGWRVMRPGSD